MGAAQCCAEIGSIRPHDSTATCRSVDSGGWEEVVHSQASCIQALHARFRLTLPGTLLRAPQASSSLLLPTRCPPRRPRPRSTQCRPRGRTHHWRPGHHGVRAHGAHSAAPGHTACKSQVQFRFSGTVDALGTPAYEYGRHSVGVVHRPAPLPKRRETWASPRTSCLACAGVTLTDTGIG